MTYSKMVTLVVMLGTDYGKRRTSQKDRIIIQVSEEEFLWEGGSSVKKRQVVKFSDYARHIQQDSLSNWTGGVREKQVNVFTFANERSCHL